MIQTILGCGGGWVIAGLVLTIILLIIGNNSLKKQVKIIDHCYKRDTKTLSEGIDKAHELLRRGRVLC